MGEPISSPASGEFSERLERLRDVKRSAFSLERYQHVFGKDVADVPGILLDVASGDASFADEVAHSPDIPATVVPVDPSYLLRPPAVKERSVAAFGEQLPFKDESVARAVSHLLFLHLSRQQAQIVIKDVLRVLQPEAEYRINATPFKFKNIWRTRFHTIQYRDLPPDVLTITKPTDYRSWPQAEKDDHAERAARAVSTQTGLYWAWRGFHRVLGERNKNNYA